MSTTGTTATGSAGAPARRSPISRMLFPTEPALRARRDRVLAVLFIVLGLALVLRAGRKEAGVLVNNQQWGARFLARQDPYLDPDTGLRVHGPYPPSLALVAVPLSLLPTRLARVLWCASQLGALWLFFVLLRRRIRRHWPELAAHASVLFALALVLVSRYLLRDTAGGGGNLLYSLLALSGVELALQTGAALSGLPLALSLVIKPNLWPLVVLLALRSRWRAFAGTLCAGAALVSLPALVYGPGAYARLTLRWASDVVRYASLDDLHTSARVPDGLPPAQDGMNQSLREAVHRLLRPPGDSGAADVHLWTVSPAAASWAARALGLGFLIATCLVARKARGARAEWLAALAFFPLALLLSPVTWKAHHVDLLPCFLALVALAAAEPRARRWLGPFLAGYWLVCGLVSKEIVGQDVRDLFQALSVVTWMDIVLVLVLLDAAARARRNADTTGPTEPPAGEPACS